ncbi:MAG: hypothetical protein IJ859_03115 [Synergistaceae bacterium]|nr:hypothetical protein [Synergistaceae bacterium]
MATSSITHNFVLSDRESIERFINAVELSELCEPKSHVVQGRLLTDKKEIFELMSKIK